MVDAITMEVPIDKAGRVVIPKPVRERLGLSPGDNLSLTIEGNQMVLRYAIKRGRVKQKHGLWTWSAGNAAAFDLMEELRKSRQERAKAMLETIN